MADMLVHLLNLPDPEPLCKKLEGENIAIFRAIAPDKQKIVEWVREHSTVPASSECDVSFSRLPISCFIAAIDNEIIGYACYDVIAPGFFGPTRVLDTYQGKGIGKALLLRCLWAQRNAGYVYGIIGGIGPAEFYEKAVGAVLIPESTPGIYKHFISKKKPQ